MRFHPAFVIILVVGCGAEGPVEKCDDLVDVVCDRGVECLGVSHSECVQAIQGELACGRAKDVSATYDRCITQLESNSCSVLFPTDPQTGEPSIRLPADCMEVILVREVPTTSPVTSPFADATRLRGD